MKKNNICTIYDNYDLYEEFEDTKAFLMEEYADEFAEDEPSDEFVWEYIYDGDRLAFDEAFHELKRFFKNKKVIVFGTLGLWTGRHDGGKIGDFEKLFHEAIQDCDYIRLYDENGHFYIECSHHDGTNHFEVKILTDRGYEYSENWSSDWCGKYDYDERTMHNHITKCSFLSRLPHFAKLVYGA